MINCYLWKILPFFKSEHKFHHLGGWREWLLDWASQMWSTAETANKLGVMCQSRHITEAIEKESTVVSSLRGRMLGTMSVLHLPTLVEVSIVIYQKPACDAT